MEKRVLSLLKRHYDAPLNAEELQYCIEKGAVAEAPSVTHDELTLLIKQAAEQVSMERAAEGFLYSITSGDMRYRTALSSLIWARALPRHECSVSYVYDGYYYCDVCGAKLSTENDKTCPDMALYARQRLLPEKNFMDTCCAGYVLNDLKLFATLPEVCWCERDIEVLNRIFGLAKEISSQNKATALLKLITTEKQLGLRAGDAYSVMGVLSACGAFDTPEYKSFADGFTACSERGFVYETDIYYPLNHWRGKHGINYGAIQRIFGEKVYERLNPDTVVSGAVKRDEGPKKQTKSAAESYFRDGEHFIDLDDRMRYYYGLSPLDPNWDREVRFSVTHKLRKRTEIYFEGDTVKKLIYEEYFGDSGYRGYVESDMDTPTRERKFILPKTDRGREQPLIPSLLQTPAYMLGQLSVYLGGRELHRYSCASSFNCSNDQQLPLAHEILDSKEDFAAYTERYIASCPEDYDRQLDDFRNKKRVTVRFTAGDIFRVLLTPTLYTYALILGKVRQLEKWSELPEKHPLRGLMTQPIIYRQYAIVTDDAHMTAEQLSRIPLLEMHIAQDNEVLWETYPIVGSKKLSEQDIDFGFALDVRNRTVVWGITMHIFDEDGVFGELADSCAYTSEYGMSLGIRVEHNDYREGAIPRPASVSDEYKRIIAQQLGLDPENACDAFAEMFGGVTRRQFIQLAEERFKK